MKNLLSNSRCNPLRLSIKLFAALSLVFLSQILFVKSASALPPTVTVTPVYSDICSTKVCCLKFTVTIPAGETLTGFSFLIMNGTHGTPEDCWDLGCASAHAVINNTTKVAGIIADHQSLTWNSLNIVGPGTFEFILCPVDPQCSHFSEWTDLTWNQDWKLGNVQQPNNGGHHVTLPPSCNGSSACPKCDQIDTYNGPGNCTEMICFTEHWPSASGVTGFTLHIVPALPAYPCTPLQSGCSSISPAIDIGSPAGWRISSIVNNGGLSTDITIIGLNALEGCQTVCIDIPKCSTTARTINVSSVTGSSSPCTPDANTGSAAFKIGSTGTVDQNNISQNYPNPLSAQTQFKTVIPFQIANEGDARISIIDVSGRTVYKDVQTFAGVGKHFFYFTGEQLPSGKYFYTIESPLGAVIVKKTLLIIK